MFKFQKEQKVFKIGEVYFGGQPGKRRTVMLLPLRSFGVEDLKDLRSMLYDAFIENPVPAALLIEGTTVDHAGRQFEAACDLAEFPIFVNPSETMDVIDLLAMAKDLGVTNRVVAGGLNVLTPEATWDSLHENGIEAAVLKALNPDDNTMKGRIYSLEDGGGVIDEGLIDRAKKYGITKPLLDLGGVGSGGSGLRALFVAKAKWGLPCTCDLGMSLNTPDSIAAMTLIQSTGADFVTAAHIDGWRMLSRTLTFNDSLIAKALAER